MSDILSVLSLIGSGVAIYKVWRLGQYYHRQLCVPAIVKELGRLHRAATQSLNDKRGHQLKDLLMQVEAILERLQDHSDKNLRTRISSARTSIRYAGNMTDVEILRGAPDVLVLINSIVANAKSFLETNQWEKP